VNLQNASKISLGLGIIRKIKQEENLQLYCKMFIMQQRMLPKPKKAQTESLDIRAKSCSEANKKVDLKIITGSDEQTFDGAVQSPYTK